jgi:hypothetical protein
MTLEEVMEWPVVDLVTGLENNIYNDRGARVPRRVAQRRATSPTFAGLLDVKDLQDLFLSDDDELFLLDDEDDGDETDGYTGIKRGYDAYPQAGLQRYRHFQANGMMNPVKPFIKEMNQLLRDQNGNQGRNGDDEDDEPEMSPHPPVTGVATQGYNSAMHYARGRGVQHHDAQLGLVTAALGGTYALTAKEKRIALERQQSCRQNLPHERFNSKIHEAEITRDLRMENVYCVDMLAIKPDYRSGG